MEKGNAMNTNDWPSCVPCSNPAHCRVGVCDVCFILRSDVEPKPTKFCPLCKSWICEDCRPNWKDRAVAALKVKTGLAQRWELPSLAGSEESMEEILAQHGK